MRIRKAEITDAAAIHDIYAPYVLNTAITFDYEVPDIKEFEGRIERTLCNYPYFVAEEDGQVVGYAYAGLFRTRIAYRHCVEVSIYIDQSRHGVGIGRMLYQKLEEALIRQNIYILYACITATCREDDGNLNDDSIRFHKKMGYQLVGKHNLCGYKFGRWYDVVWMEKVIAQRPEVPDSFIPFRDIGDDH